MDTMQELPRKAQRTWLLTPAECNPEREMPLTLLVDRLIEVATLHADDIGIGYENLSPKGQTWVLSRIGLQMDQWPTVDTSYTICTWVAGINRLFSERNFTIFNSENKIIGHARTAWCILDIEKRTACDLTPLAWIKELIPDNPDIPIPLLSRPVPPADPHIHEYRFNYCDLDCNRHVNSSRYIQLLLNQWPLEFHDQSTIRNFEIAYIHEAKFGQKVHVNFSDATPTRCEIIDAEDRTPICRASFTFRLRG